MRNSSEIIAELALVELYFAYAELSAENSASSGGARALKYIEHATKSLESITGGRKKADRAESSKAA
jgi:hypothetical protein